MTYGYNRANMTKTGAVSMAEQTISLCVIAKSGRELFQNCLESIVPYVDEVVVVIDGDSPDGCDDVARQFGAKVFYREMDGDFSAQRNFSFEQATGDWYFWMDSDDVIPTECAKMLRPLVEKGARKGTGVYLFDYHYAFDENGRVNTVLKRERLMRADLPWRWKYEIHEVCVCDRPEGQPDAVYEPGVWIVHRKQDVPETFRDPGRNLRFVERIMPKYEAEGDVRMLFYAGNEYMSASRFEEAEGYYARLIDMEGEWFEQRVLAAIRLAQIRFVQERYDDAKDLCFRAIQIDHHWADPYCMLGDLAMIEKDWDRAVHFFDIASHMPIPTGKVLLPYDPARFTWYPRYRKHLALAEMGRYPEALAVVEELLERYMPDNDELAVRAADLADLASQTRRKGLEGVVAVRSGLPPGHVCSLRQRALEDGLLKSGVDFDVLDEISPTSVGGKLCVIMDASLRASEKTIASIRGLRTDVVFDFCGSPADLEEEQLVETMRAASAVTTNSPFLLERVRSINPRAFYIPDPVLPGSAYVGPRPIRDHVRFLIVTTTRKDAGSKIIPLIEDEARKAGKRWAIKVIGVDDFASGQYDDESFLKAVAESDIGICYFHRDDEWHGAEFLPSMMASGLPTIASGNAAVNDVIDHRKTGFVCYHADEWRQAISTLVGDSRMCDEMGRRAALKARRYDATAYTDRWADAGSVRIDRLDVVVPVHSQVDHVAQCVKSLGDNSLPTTKPILVVNPTSPDDVVRVTEIALAHPSATIIEQSWIRNFAANCNAGARVATGSMVSLLNSDTIVTPGWDQELMQIIMDNGPGIAAAYSNGEWGWRHKDDLHIGEGDDLLPLRQEHEIDEMTHRVDEIYELGRRIHEEHSGEVEVVDWVTFAAVVMPRTLFLEVGELDDRFQNDSEDVDFCRRTRKLGGKCYYSKGGFVFHYCGVSRDAVDGGMETPARKSMLDRNRLLLDTKMRRENRTIRFFLGKSWEPWLPESIDETGIGGSETCVVNAARCLAQIGWNVEVFATEDRHPNFRDGVTYYHHAAFDPNEPCDVLFVVRKPELFDYDLNARIKVLYLHDATYGEPGSMQYPSPERVDRMDRIFVLSQWHKDTMQEQYPHIPDEKFFVTTNGIDIRRFDRGMRGHVRKDPKRFVYSSSGDRGLEVLLSMWPLIYKCDPDYRLHLYYGFETWKRIASARGDQQALDRMENVVRMSQHPGIVTHGRVGQARLAEEMAASNLWLYPTWFTETSCITAMEAMASGVRGITTPLAALVETATYARFVEGDCKTPEYQRLFMEQMLEELTQPDFGVRNEAIRSTIQKYDWRRVVATWDAILMPELVRRETPTLGNPFAEAGGKKIHFVMPFGGSGGVQYPIELAAELDRIDGIETRCTLVKFGGEDFDLLPLLPDHPRISIVSFDDFRRAADDVFACDHIVSTNWQTSRLLRDMGANRRIDLRRHVLIQGDERSWAPLDQVSAMMSDAAWQRIYVSEHLRVALQAPGVVVPDGVDVSMFTPGEDAPERDEQLIGCIIHPSSEVKNTDIVLNAASEMGGECKLLAVVAAPELEGDERISRICSDVVWGPVHKSDIARAMFRCGAWLVPSTEEGFGIVGLEAMLAGCVLITAAPGGMKTYVRPDENAIRVFNPRSQAQWMNMMKAYLGGKPEDLAEVRRRAREMAEGFSISRSATLFLDAITSSNPSDPDPR